MVSTTYSGPERRSRPSAAAADADRPVARISWGAIFAGVVVMLALQILLNMLGLGVGIATIDPTGETPEAASLGLGAGIWWVVSNIIAVAAGGYAASRLAGAHRSRDGQWHGLVAWCLNLLIAAYLVTTAVGSVIGGAMGMIGNVAGRVGDVAEAAAPQVAGQLANIDIGEQARALLAPANQQPANGDQAASQMADILRGVVSDPENPQIDRGRAVQLISQQAGINEQEANQRLDQLLTTARDTAAQARQTAEATADTVSQAAIWGFAALVLGAIAAVMGGRFGADHAVTSAARRDGMF